MPPPPPRAPSPARRRALGALAVTLVAAAIAAPAAMVAAGSQRAAACFAAIEGPRGPALPGCGREVGWLSLPSRLPWTRRAASLRAEELGARAAVAAYADAAVGRPDRAALDRAATDVEIAANVVASGSQRLRLEDLGPVVGAPHLGREAARLGDRGTLLGRADRWGDWYVRLHALRAALTEADISRAVAIAERYAGFDPRDEDLRTAVAAVLCLGGDAKRGVELLTLTQEDRATRRYAGMARNWGDVHALRVACAARAGAAPPPSPESPQAGDDDAVEVRAAQEVRVAEAEGDVERARRGAEAARALLASSTRAPAPASRLGLLAVLLAYGAPIDAARAAALSRARVDEGESRLATGPLLAADWLPAPGLARPVVAAPALARAAERAAELAGGAGVTADDRAELSAAAGALAFEAARELAATGDAPAAIAILDRLGPGAVGAQRGVELALARSSAWVVAGDPARALDALDGAPLESAAPAARAATALQRAELLASLGRRGEAARAAVIADEVAEAAGATAPPERPDEPPALHPFPVLDARARWTRLALARPPEGGPLRPGAAPAAAAPPRPTSAGSPWPWVGFANAATPWARLDQGALSVALARWDAARAAPPDERRALRYAALQRRGDAPPALIAYLSVGAELLGPGEGDVEAWLDALLAFDARRFSYRQHAFARAEAARWRGDAEAAALWRGRYEALRVLATDPRRAEIARYLGI